MSRREASGKKNGKNKWWRVGKLGENSFEEEESIMLVSMFAHL